MGYIEKTTSFPHQAEEFRDHGLDIARGLLWEMGTGKSKETTDQAGQLIENGQMDALVIAAPDGVHRNWINEELPIHMPERILSRMRTFAYDTEKAATKWHQAEAEAVLAHPGPIAVAMSYDATTTDPLMSKDPVTGRRKTTWRGGKRFLWDLLSNRKCMLVSDESRRIKNPNAQRTKVLVKAAPYAKYRRLLNGTPVPNGPFDLYSQLKFLDERFWEPHGIHTFAAFKAMFGVFETARIRVPGGALREFPQLVTYRNLELLHQILGTICSRKTKEEVLDLPPKLYSRASFDMTPAQQRVYGQLRDEFMTWLDESTLVTAPLAITRLLRFQQVTSGFLPVEGEEPYHDIGASNPRLELLKEICEDVPHKAIIWTRFNRTTDLVMDMLRKMGRNPVRYDGQVTGDAREEAKIAFQKGDADFFVAKASTAGDGLTLHAARTVIYCENTFDLAARLQSEDRAHRIGQLFPVNYIDLMARQSVDERIVAALVEKMDIANQITGDVAKQWLQAA